MRNTKALSPRITVGLDLGDRRSRVCEVDRWAEVMREAWVVTTPAGIAAYFEDHARCRVIMEAGTHSPWVARQLEALGYEVVVGNPSQIYGKGRRKKRNDRTDGEFLARQGRADPKLLYPIQHRGAEAQTQLAVIRARDQVVQSRTKLINHVRGAVKAHGARLERCSAEAFDRRAAEQIPETLQPALAPVLEMIGLLTQRIRTYDTMIERVLQHYPEAVHLQQPKGVGPITALGYVLLVDDPHRFPRSRDVGAFFGLVPRLDDSSDSHPQLGITKAGDELGRRLLVSAAHYVLGPHGPECDLRRYGEAIARRGGKNAKKRAVVAVARKIAVLLHRLWVTGAVYEPDRQAQRKAA